MITHHSIAGTTYTIRPVDSWRDLPIIIDLIELGFKTELDPQGWKIIAQTRTMLKRRAVSRLILGGSDDASGFICELDGYVVGNLSLRRASPYGRGRMIGNVVVRPEHRGRGIAKALMQRALATARRQGAAWIGLEVREDNAPACHIYQQLGFRAEGRSLHYIRKAQIPWPDIRKPDRNWRYAKPIDAQHWVYLAQLCFSPAQRDIMEIRASQYRYGNMERNLSLRLMHQIERAWLYDDDSIQMAVRTKTDKQYHFHVWDILMRPQLGQNMAQEAINRALLSTHRFPTWDTIAVIADLPALEQSLLAHDFHLHRTLVQMKYIL